MECAVSSGEATLIWPPSGVALAAVLLLGHQALPGIVAGALAFGLWSTAVEGMAGLSAASAGLIATGAATAVLQALVGRFLLKRFGRFPNALDDGRTVLAMLALGGVAAGFSAPCSILPSPPYLHPVAIDTLLFTGSSRWVGNILGVALFTPLFLAWWSRADQQWASRRPAVTICLGSPSSGHCC